jgi:hypothetical protein
MSFNSKARSRVRVRSLVSCVMRSCLAVTTFKLITVLGVVVTVNKVVFSEDKLHIYVWRRLALIRRFDAIDESLMVL